MACKYCKCRGKKCAFRNKIFSPNNWNCGVMNLLRDIAKEAGFYYRNDDIGSFGFVPFIDLNDEWGNGSFIVMTWYKNRGRTSDAFVVWNEKEERRELTFEDAVSAIEYNGHLLKEEF